MLPSGKVRCFAWHWAAEITVEVFMVSAKLLRDRVSGSLYGLLVGDALGCPAEGMSAEAIAETYGRLDDMCEADRWWRPAGLHSDDGQQAIALLDAVLADPIRPVAPFARALVALRNAGPAGFRRFGLHRGTGGNFRNTVMALRKRDDLGGANVDEESLFDHATVTAGNGAAMRVAPLALFFREDADALLDALVRTARLTHADVRGIAGAAAVAFVVQRALGLSTSSDGLLASIDRDALLAFVRRAEDVAIDVLGDDAFARGMSAILEEVLRHSGDDQAALCERIAAEAEKQSDRPVGAGAGFAPASVTLSVCVALEARSFEDAVVDVIAAGEDTDTTAAMVGQMVGAACGRSAIPSRWMAALWARGVLEDRIDALLTRRVPFEAGFSLVELESPWTEALYAGQENRKARGKSKGPAKASADVDTSATATEDPAPSLFESGAPSDATPSADADASTPNDSLTASASPATASPANASAAANLSAQEDESGEELDDEEEDLDEDGDEPFWMTMESERDEAPAPAAPAAEFPAASASAPAPSSSASAATPARTLSPPPSSSAAATVKAAPPVDDDTQLSIFDVAPARTIGRPRPPDAPAPAQPKDAAPAEAASPAASEPPAHVAPEKNGKAAKADGPLFSPPAEVAQEPPVDEVRLPSGTLLTLLKGDITKIRVDAIVNAANTSLLGGGGVDGAIHRAGGPEILDECRAVRARQGGCKTGEAVITTAGRLPALRVIHTVGPRWRGGEHREEELLKNAYSNVLRLARENNLKTVAFPSISTGIYKFPIERAARIALKQIADDSAAHPGAFDAVTIVLFEAPDLWIYQRAKSELFPS